MKKSVPENVPASPDETRSWFVDHFAACADLDTRLIPDVHGGGSGEMKRMECPIAFGTKDLDALRKRFSCEPDILLTTAFGLTISVPRSMFSDTALENLRRLLAVKNELICKALEIDSTAIEVNDETVSFPWWEKDLTPTEVRICSQFIDRLCKFAIASKRVTAKIKTSENERFDMRCWLIRLGCSGPEYKELRAAFMKNLDGDTAFRYGRPEAQRRAEQSVNSEEAQSDAE